MNKLVTIHDDEFKRVEDNEKLVTLVSREYQRFLKDQREMTYRDWLIEKKLVEGGGLGRRVYIHVGRGNGKTATLIRHIEDIESKGKEVRIVDYRDSVKKFTRPNSLVVDWDLISNLTGRRSEPTYLDMIRDFEISKAREQHHVVMPWERLEQNIFKRQYLGRWHFKEDEDASDQNREYNDSDYNGG